MKLETVNTLFIATLLSALKTYWALLKIIIPILILIKVLIYFNGLVVLEALFSPLLSTLNLPIEAGVVFVTGLITNLYGAIILYLSLLHDVSFSTSQVTTLAIMMLFAHSLPLELAISKKMGGKIFYLFMLRILVAYLAGFLLYHVHSIFNLYQGQAEALLMLDEVVTQRTIMQEIIAHLHYLATIFIIIYLLLIFREILRQFSLYSKVIQQSEPIFVYIGLKKNAVEVLMTGLLLGIIYGGTLLIQSLKDNVFSQREIIVMTIFLSLMHGVVEDTILVILMGASIFDVLVIKNFIAVTVICTIARFMKKDKQIKQAKPLET